MQKQDVITKERSQLCANLSSAFFKYNLNAFTLVQEEYFCSIMILRRFWDKV